MTDAGHPDHETEAPTTAPTEHSPGSAAHQAGHDPRCETPSDRHG